MSLPSTIQSPAPRTRAALALPLALTGVFLALGFLSPARTKPPLAWTFSGVAAFLLCWQGALYLRSKRKDSALAWEYAPVRSHYVQALVQLSIYVYWGWYWRNVYAEAPLILSQVVFLYIFDALLTWSRGQTWRLGFGPWPIIFSTNLFMWFRDDWFVFQFMMVALGVLGKQFIRWERGGKLTHIFNPSAFALTVVSLILICTGTSGITWGEQIALTQGRPPHLYTEIFVCGLVVQYFFSVTLLTFSAAAMIGLLSVAYTKVTGVYLFFDTNIPIAVFLGLHLLMTDPATTPRSSLGRIMFGGLYGACVFGAVFVLEAIAAPTFYDKLLVVPMLNLLTPALDRLAALGAAGKFGRWEMATGPRKLNLVFMGAWVALFMTMRASGFVEAPHPGKTLGFWQKAAEENRPHAVKNLRYLLNEFAKLDLDEPAEGVQGVGPSGLMSREQAMGIMCSQVAFIYARGQFVPADPAKAAHYMAAARRFYEKSAALGELASWKTLALMQLNGEGGPPDPAAAAHWLQKGADAQDGPSCLYLAKLYHLGDGVPRDEQKANALLEKACALGVQPACEMLKLLKK